MATATGNVVALTHEYLFDRGAATHPWTPLLKRSEADATLGAAQMVANWRMDWRVAPDTEAVLAASGCFQTGTVAGTLATAAADFHRRYQCRPVDGLPEPPYRGVANRDNRIDMARIAPNANLLRLVSLNRMLRFFVRRGGAGRADIDAYLNDAYALRLPRVPDRASGDALCDRLVDGLRKRGEQAIREFSRRLADALGPNEPHWWACFAHEVDADIVSDDWSTAAGKLGLGHLDVGDWLLGWRYCAREAAPLFRPTVVDAVDNAFHHPSPRSYPYGLTMGLGARTAAIAEVVHAPLKEDDSFDFSLGRIGRLTRPYAGINNAADWNAWFAGHRAAHRALLAARYEDDRSWIERHRDLP